MAKNKNESKGFFKSTFRPSVWLDSSRITGFWLYVKQSALKLFVPQKKQSEESFEQAKKRLKLNNKELLKREKALFRLSIFICVIALCILIYSIVLIVQRFYLGACSALAVSGIAFVLAFRYHFWYYQIHTKQLGCTLSEWFSQGLLGGKKQ